MAGSRPLTLGRCTAALAAGDSPAVVVAEEKGKKRPGSELAAEDVKAVAVEEVEGHEKVEGGFEDGAVEKKKWRMSQAHIDFIMSWDVSDFVFSAPDNIDDMPVSEEVKLKFRASRQEAVTIMRERRRANKEIQEWVKSELEKHGYVEIETTSEMFARYRNDLEEQGYVEVKNQ